MYIRKKRIIYIYVFLIFLFTNQAYATSIFSTTQANRIGKSYAHKIKYKFITFKEYSSALLCNKFILHDIDIKHNKQQYFLSDYLIKHYDEDFLLRTFRSCVVNLDLLKINNTKNEKL